MLNKFFTWLADYVLSLFQTKADERAIDKETVDIADKKVEADVKLKELSDLGVLKTTAANEAQVLTDKVAADDAVVKQADAETKTATERITAIKRKTGITQSELADKLDHLNLDDV